MNPDKIQEAYAEKKRKQQELADKTATEAKQRQVVGATDAVQRAVIEAQKLSIKHREQVAVDTEKKLAEVTDAINKMNLSVFTASQPKMADMVENLKTLCEEMGTLSEQFKQVGFKPVSEAMSQLIKKIDAMPKQISDIVIKLEKDGKEEKLLRDVVTALKELKLDPQINVAAPKVSVPSIDTTGIEQAIRDSKPEAEAEIDMDDYRGVIIDNESSDTMQYVGFLSPTGEWYILYNDLMENRFLYKFGQKGFNQGWKRRMNYDYKPLDAAASEVL